MCSEHMKQMQKEPIKRLSPIMPKTVDQFLKDEEEKDKFNMKTSTYKQSDLF
jgi:hypothetical protein